MPVNDYDRLPNFFLAGVAKSGTTSVAAYLAQHPQVFISKPKEPHFFSNATRFADGVDRYLTTSFRGAENYPCRGDATASTFYRHDNSIPNLRTVYGDRPLKFIVIFRNPVERAWSQYLHQVSLGAETLDFDAAIAAEPERRRTHPDTNMVQYVHSGFYAAQARVWLRHYDRACFHFLLTDDLRTDAQAVMRGIFTFLAVDPDFPVDVSEQRNTAARLRSRMAGDLINRPPALLRWLSRLLIPDERQRHQLRHRLRRYLRVRNGKAPPSIPPDTAERLYALYRDDIRQLADLIGRDLSSWEDKYSRP